MQEKIETPAPISPWPLLKTRQVLEAVLYVPRTGIQGEGAACGNGAASSIHLSARQWVVEARHAWLNRFRRLLVWYEKKAGNYRGLVEFPCALIIWRNLIRSKAFY